MSEEQKKSKMPPSREKLEEKVLEVVEYFKKKFKNLASFEFYLPLILIKEEPRSFTFYFDPKKEVTNKLPYQGYKTLSGLSPVTIEKSDDSLEYIEYLISDGIHIYLRKNFRYEKLLMVSNEQINLGIINHR